MTGSSRPTVEICCTQKELCPMPPQVTDSPISATEVNVARIFSDDYAFAIPPYQRPYAWDLEQASELLTDLQDALGQANGGRNAYFLGSIVLIKSRSSPEAKIVDGQQRLTTLTILFSVIRDLTSAAEQKLSRHRYVCQSGNPDLETEDRYRLLLRERDQSFFERKIQTLGATDTLPSTEVLDGSELRIVENAHYFRGKLASMDETSRNKLTAFILQHCYLVVVAVPTPEAARRIFTVLNARGLDLTATDILKADLLERVGPQRETALAREWEDIEEELGRERFVELFVHIRMIFEREKPRSALESAFREVVAPFDQAPAAFIAEILQPLSEAMQQLEKIAELQTAFGTEASCAVRSLNRIDNKDWVPPAILSLWLYRQGRISAAAAAQFLIGLERVAYYLFVIRGDVNQRILRFADVMDEVAPRTRRSPPAHGISLTEAERAEFYEALDDPLYRKIRVCKPVLQRLDEALSTRGATYEDPTSIEHVLPQKVEAGSEWASLFPDEAEREHWTHRLANLVFLTRRTNIRASNWDFERKKGDYFQSRDGRNPYPITQEVLDTETWTPAHLEARQLRLLGVLAGVWHLPLPEPAAS
jgi:hypothetical protein